MCRSRLWLLYWVSTQILRMLALAMLDNAKSISRYSPPNGTAGLARSAVSGLSRVPAPPASTIPNTDRSGMIAPYRGSWLLVMLSRVRDGGEDLADGLHLHLHDAGGPPAGGPGIGGLPRLADQHLQCSGQRDSQQRRDKTTK